MLLSYFVGQKKYPINYDLKAIGNYGQNAGGGIQSTTNATRQATEEELTQKAAKALDEMMRFGTTTCEAKSGYGLALDHELKQLRAIRRLQEEHPMDVTATFMGAHLVPTEYKQDRAEYIRLVCEEMMPAVKEQGIAKFCDVFCEADTFTAVSYTHLDVYKRQTPVRSVPPFPPPK